MPTYVNIFHLTQKGVENVRKGPERVAAAKRLYQAVGAKIKEFYLVMGQYDAVVISEAPDDETATKAVLAISSLGYVRSESMRAFTEEEYRKLIESLPASYGTAQER
ncbi:MAG TPA: GYD domain-containing protein [Gemmataceae bacterium]|nr:GYD domain-containing protein [Gemmataceae bacterium]